MSVYQFRRGWYNITVYICVVRENNCTYNGSHPLYSSQYKQLRGTPVKLYLTSKFPNASNSIASGESLESSIVQRLQ